jgi:hypothetical protein
LTECWLRCGVRSREHERGDGREDVSRGGDIELLVEAPLSPVEAECKAHRQKLRALRVMRSRPRDVRRGSEAFLPQVAPVGCSLGPQARGRVLRCNRSVHSVLY